MAIFIAFLACAVPPLVRGRTLAPLAELRLRAVWAAGLALAIQVVILGVAPGGNRPLHAALHISSYALAGWFAWANRAVPGVAVLAAGGALNLLAIAFNGGVMPASPAAMAVAGMHPSGGFENSTVVAHPHLAFLGDVIPVPGPGPLRNVLSVGDLVLLAGAVLLVRRCSAPARRA